MNILIDVQRFCIFITLFLTLGMYGCQKADPEWVRARVDQWETVLERKNEKIVRLLHQDYSDITVSQLDSLNSILEGIWDEYDTLRMAADYDDETGNPIYNERKLEKKIEELILLAPQKDNPSLFDIYQKMNHELEQILIFLYERNKNI